MARPKKGDLVGMVGGEWTESDGVWKPVYHRVLQVRDLDGACLLDYEAIPGWLRATDLEDISEEVCG